MTVPNPTLEGIINHLGAIGAGSVLDIGCGNGSLVRALSERGFSVVGIDPQAPSGDPRLLAAGAEALPFADQSFDAAVFLNALHHVPYALMNEALAEALRVIKPNGLMIVIEPLARGSFFEVMRIVDDETKVRHEALTALDALNGATSCTLIENNVYMRETVFNDIQQYFDYLLRAEPMRAATIKAKRGLVTTAFHDHAQKTDRGFLLLQPLLRRVYSRSAS